jgi:aerobic C4-dicarboxylate transport protein
MSTDAARQESTIAPPLYKRLYFQVLVGICAGVLVGHFYPAIGIAVKPLGEAFI